MDILTLHVTRLEGIEEPSLRFEKKKDAAGQGHKLRISFSSGDRERGISG